jgi:hypothetical protein
MIVFDLKCGQDHVFEAWFGSSSAYESQRERGLVSCPICGSVEIGKAVMAPAVAPKSNRAPDRPVPMHNAPDEARMRAIVEGLARAQAEALKESIWVGRDFAEKARAMHYGEEGHASIHGEVAPGEAKALVEEGVQVAPLLFPVVPDKARN